MSTTAELRVTMAKLAEAQALVASAQAALLAADALLAEVVDGDIPVFSTVGAFAASRMKAHVMMFTCDAAQAVRDANAAAAAAAEVDPLQLGQTLCAGHGRATVAEFFVDAFETEVGHHALVLGAP